MSERLPGPEIRPCPPAGSAPPSPRNNASGRLNAWVALAREWAGREALASMVSGSHATGDAVWAPGPRGPVSLSDLDLYVVVRDRRAQREAAARARAWRRADPAPRTRLLELGLGAALECAFLPPDDLERLPARPGTLELRRHGRVVEGDPSWLDRVPDWSPHDIGAEEILLLLENRAFELLDARRRAADPDALSRLGARHSVLKTALDLATVECLAAGEYPDGAAERVATARDLATRRGPGGRGGEEPPWEAALSWRAGRVEPIEPAAAEREWLATARAWLRAWEARAGSPQGGAPGEAGPGDPYATARRAARRARLRRRARLAAAFGPPGGAGPGLVSRLWFCARGTPQHRLNASAAVLVARAVREREAGLGPERGAAMEMEWARTLDWLGVLRGATDPAEAEREVLRRWDRWILDGQRATEAR